jgi:predicted MPP superfamily phosphohydrolase
MRARKGGEEVKRPVASAITTALLLFIGITGYGYGQNGSPGASKEAHRADSAVKLILPVKEGSVRFAVIGDTGSGSEEQRQLADLLMRYRSAFPFEFVLMMGDNLYGGESASDYKKKFENVYKELLDAKVKFYATLGNHDESNQRFYEHFNMNGEEYYKFKKGKVSFYALNSNYMEKKQLKWLEDELSKDSSEWKICFLHHPPYSSGKKHGSDMQLREVVEPIFLNHGVSLVLTGHEHFYERIKPQKGIHYFISGAGGKLRPGDVKPSRFTEKSFDKDMHFILFEVVDDQIHFQTISRAGQTIDSGILNRQKKDTPVPQGR